jgi:hypothetical protein
VDSLPAAAALPKHISKKGSKIGKSLRGLVKILSFGKIGDGGAHSDSDIDTNSGIPRSRRHSKVGDEVKDLSDSSPRMSSEESLPLLAEQVDVEHGAENTGLSDGYDSSQRK